MVVDIPEKNQIALVNQTGIVFPEGVDDFPEGGHRPSQGNEAALHIVDGLKGLPGQRIGQLFIQGFHLFFKGFEDNKIAVHYCIHEGIGQVIRPLLSDTAFLVPDPVHQ